ncbi:CHASE2 domain-containing protein [Halospina sp. K52047b]|uniref:CHASE2 domain-containing protein n=1 Tax=Halospina sp. K52047b TaxID=2614160 RepID=UPI001787C76B|nr:CHASE2 domain-containing protein [Halospina sp. K52047b]
MLKAAPLFLARWLLYSVLGLVTLFTDPFGLSAATDKASADVIYRITAPFYRSEAQGAITLVLIDGRDVRELHRLGILQTNEWPLRYSDWRTVLRAIDGFKPEAVFLDVLFERERTTDPTLPSLLNYLERSANTRPLYIAGGQPPYSAPLQEKLAANASLVGTGWQGGYDGIPLTQEDKPMAALSLYRHACMDAGALGCTQSAEWTQRQSALDPLSVRWGSEPRLRLTAQLQGFSPETFCTNAAGGVMATFRLFYRSLLNGVIPEDKGTGDAPCLYHQAIPLQAIFHIIDDGTERERQALRDALENRLVLVGTSFEGLPDRVDTPVLGQVPGVALHAMMLDNLMAYGSNYLRQPRENQNNDVIRKV